MVHEDEGDKEITFKSQVNHDVYLGVLGHDSAACNDGIFTWRDGKNSRNLRSCPSARFVIHGYQEINAQVILGLNIKKKRIIWKFSLILVLILQFEAPLMSRFKNKF